MFFATHRIEGALVCLAMAALGAVAAHPDADWPRFLGPTGNNISAESGLLDRWPAGGPRVVWSRPIGAGYGAPSVRGNRLVLHHRLGDEEIVEAMNPGNGETIWRHSYPSQFVDPYGYNNGPRGTPLLSANRCYTFGAEGKLVCLELESGRTIWRRDTGREWNVPEAFFGVGSTPLLESDRLFVMVGGLPNAGMVALDARTGKTLWENVGETTWQGKTKTGWRGEPPVNWAGESKQASYSSPIAATIHGRRHLLCLMRQGLVSLDPENGRVNFAFWFRAQVDESVNAIVPVVSEDLIFISAAYYKIGSVLLRVRPDGRSVEEVWRDTVLELHWSTPILHQGFLYGFSGRNEPEARFRCVELKTGRLRWDRDETWSRYSAKQPPAFGRGSLILADGKLIALGEGGLLGLFKVDSNKPGELARWQVPGLSFPCWTAPVLANRKLYLRSENRLVCLDLSRPRVDTPSSE